MLEETVKLLENRATSSHTKKSSVTVQTEILRCEECEFPADCMIDLVDHMHEFHPLPTIEEGLECHYCGERFPSKSEVMKHRKDVHTEKVNHCTKFSEGESDFGESCWFKHDEIFKHSNPDYECNICENKFKTKRALMKHKKEQHIEIIPICKYSKNGCCMFRPINCWFNHKNIHETQKNHFNNDMENNEMIRKLFDMMEQFTNRLVKIENST